MTEHKIFMKTLLPQTRAHSRYHCVNKTFMLHFVYFFQSFGGKVKSTPGLYKKNNEVLRRSINFVECYLDNFLNLLKKLIKKNIFFFKKTSSSNVSHGKGCQLEYSDSHCNDLSKHVDI